MKNVKRVLAVMLATLMLSAMLVVPASARYDYATYYVYASNDVRYRVGWKDNTTTMYFSGGPIRSIHVEYDWGTGKFPPSVSMGNPSWDGGYVNLTFSGGLWGTYYYEMTTRGPNGNVLSRGTVTVTVV